MTVYLSSREKEAANYRQVLPAFKLDLLKSVSKVVTVAQISLLQRFRQYDVKCWLFCFNFGKNFLKLKIFS